MVVSFDDDFTNWAAKMKEHGMMGPGYSWTSADAVTSFVVAGQGAAISNGFGKILSLGGMPGNTYFDKFISDWVENDADTGLVAYAESIWYGYVADAGHQFAAGSDLSDIPDDFFANNLPDDVATYAYDSVMTMALAGCDYKAAGGSFVDADYDVDSFFRAMTETKFESITGSLEYITGGVSGTESGTGNRNSTTGNYVMLNAQCEGEACTMYSAGKWSAADGWDWSAATGGSTTPTGAFRFSDDTFVPPPDFLKPEEEKNLLSSSLVTIGTLLVAINYVLAAALGFLTFKHRKHRVIRASQPMFLYMILIGCCLSTSTILTFGVDDGGEYENAGDVNCMMSPFLYR